MKKIRVAILGSTGSIGVNSLKVIAAHSKIFEVVAITAFSRVKVFESQISACHPKYAAIAPEHVPGLRKRHPGVKFFDVTKDLPGLVVSSDIDVIVIGMTGAAGLAPFLAAVKAGKKVAPANKEALVMAGDILMAEARKSGAVIIPVDSEQSAIFQCLDGRSMTDVHQVHLTASGGALRNVARSRHDKISVKEILDHPRWKMGEKITVDSATLMNKGFEVIEACRLFGLSADKIKVLIHPEAIIHSMVEFMDGSILAQLGVTDMQLPIQYALTYPQRLPTPLKRLDFPKLARFTFEAPDMRKFPSLGLAYEALQRGGVTPAVLNAADEVAVDAFLKGKIRFTRIYTVVEKTMAKCRHVMHPVLKDIEQADAWARIRALEEIERLS